METGSRRSCRDGSTVEQPPGASLSPSGVGGAAVIVIPTICYNRQAMGGSTVGSVRGVDVSGGALRAS